MFVYRQQVGQRLARVFGIGQRVHNRHTRSGCKAVQRALGECAQHRQIGHLGHDLGHVLCRFPLVEAHLFGAKVNGLPTEQFDSDPETQLRPE